MGINRTSFGLKRIGFGCTVNQDAGGGMAGNVPGATTSPVGGNEYIATWVSDGSRSSGTPHGDLTWTTAAAPATTTNPSTLVMTNNGRRSSIIDANLIRTVINAAEASSSSIRLVMSGGGGGSGYPRGNGQGGRGGSGGHVEKTALVVDGNGSYNIYVGAGGGTNCSNMSGYSGMATLAFDGRAGSGGGGTSEHNGNCNGCGYDPSSSLTGSNSAGNGAGGGCNMGSNAGRPAHTSDITGSNVSYGGGNSAVGSGGGLGSNGGGPSPGSAGQGGVVVIRWDNAVLDIV